MAHALLGRTLSGTLTRVAHVLRGTTGCCGRLTEHARISLNEQRARLVLNLSWLLAIFGWWTASSARGNIFDRLIWINGVAVNIGDLNLMDTRTFSIHRLLINAASSSACTMPSFFPQSANDFGACLCGSSGPNVALQICQNNDVLYINTMHFVKTLPRWQRTTDLDSGEAASPAQLKTPRPGLGSQQPFGIFALSMSSMPMRQQKAAFASFEVDGAMSDDRLPRSGGTCDGMDMGTRG